MSALTAKLFIDEPPVASWTGCCIELTIRCGELEFTRLMSRHAAVGLYMELHRELALGREPGPEALFGRLAGGAP